MIKNLGVLISESFFLGLAPLKETKQGINYSISLFLMIINLEMILREVLGPEDLAKAQTLDIHKLTEVIVVNEDENLVFVAF